MTRTLLTAALLGVLAGPSAAQTSDTASNKVSAEAPAPMVISTGAQGGGYWGIGSRLATAIEKRRGAVEVRSSSGSMENLQRLQAPVDPTSLALTQSDALAVFLQTHPAFVESFDTVESIGRECVFVIAAADSGIDSFDDFESGDHRLAIPSQTSGVAVTFKAMQSMRPALDATQAVYLPPDQAMLELTRPADQRQVDALMLVHRPKVRSEALKQAIFNPGQYHLVPLDDAGLDSILPNGKPVYSQLKLPLVRENWTARKTLDTVCMEGLLLSAPQKLSPEQAVMLKQAVDFDWMQIYAEPRRP